MFYVAIYFTYLRKRETLMIKTYLWILQCTLTTDQSQADGMID